jgi:hypothetical protein
MKNAEKICLDAIQNVADLSAIDAQTTNGGGFAYDAGFFCRSMWVYMSNGGMCTGAIAATVDFAFNYKSV